LRDRQQLGGQFYIANYYWHKRPNFYFGRNPGNVPCPPSGWPTSKFRPACPPVPPLAELNEMVQYRGTTTAMRSPSQLRDKTAGMHVTKSVWRYEFASINLSFFGCASVAFFGAHFEVCQVKNCCSETLEAMQIICASRAFFLTSLLCSMNLKDDTRDNLHQMPMTMKRATPA